MYPGQRNFAGGLGLGPAGVHRTQRKTATGANTPEFLELKHLAVAVEPINTGGIGNQYADLTGLVGVVVVFLGLQEKRLLEQRMQSVEGIEDLVLAAQLELVFGQCRHRLA